MYKCEKCNHVVKAGNARLTVTINEAVIYPYRAKVNETWDKRLVDDRGGVGTQIVREIPVCFRCHEAAKDSFAVGV